MRLYSKIDYCLEIRDIVMYLLGQEGYNIHKNINIPYLLNPWILY